jgi:DNA-binding response OmpR family regulator
MGTWGRTEPLRIIVLDDDAEVAEAICDLFDLQRHLTHAVHDLASAWRAIRDGPPDVLVADYHIGVMNSGLLLALVRYHFPGVGRVLVSASSVREWGHLVDGGLVHAALMKPFLPLELIAIVEAIAGWVEGDG